MVSPTGTYTDVAFAGEDGSYTSLEWTLKPLNSPPNDGYFWARQFGGYAWDGTAYMGLQTRVNGLAGGDQKGVIASIPNALGAESPGVAISTAPEYDGWSVRILYAWQAGSEYRLRVVKGADGGSGTRWWNFWIKDVRTNVDTYVGRIRVPGSPWGDLWGNGTCFSERYSGVSMVDCSDQEYAACEFKAFTANDGAIAASGLNNHLADPVECPNAAITPLSGGARHEMGIPEGGGAGGDGGDGGAPGFAGGAGGICFHTRDGWYVLNGVTMAQGGVWMPDLWDLFLSPEVAGENTPRPGYPGTFPNPYRWTETTYDLPILVASEIDVSTGLPWTGGDIPATDSAAFERNLLWLRRTCHFDSSGARTVDAVLHTPDGYTLTEEVQPLRIIRDEIIEAPAELGTGLLLTGTAQIRYPGGGHAWPEAPV